MLIESLLILKKFKVISTLKRMSHLLVQTPKLIKNQQLINKLSEEKKEIVIKVILMEKK